MAFDAWLRFLVTYVAAKTAGMAPVWNHIPPDAVSGLEAAADAWTAAYTVYQGPHTPVDTLAKKEARKAAEDYVRPFVNQYLRFPPVTDEDREAMGIPNKDPKPTPIPAPSGIPEVVVEIPHPRIIHIRFKAVNAERWGKPEGVTSMECVWVLAGTPPANISDLVHTALSSRSPLTLSFEENERGSHCYFAVRWLTGTIKAGDWSEIFHVIVP
jgi:hypothetical protein